MSDALKILHSSQDPNLLVSFDTRDDAVVYQVSDDIAYVSTADFITPPVDDPYWFGQIAASNALSDIYAMGGKPVTALNLIMFPLDKLGGEVLKEILRGGQDKVMEAGASLAGGHSIDDNEPKYGLAVTGLVHPDKILSNCGIEIGDALILTKPLGTGVLFNACRDDLFPYSALEELLPQIASLNALALEVARQFDINACTDISGFGFAGHLFEMAQKGFQINIFYNNLPFYPHALQMSDKGVSTRSNKANEDEVKNFLEMARTLSPGEKAMLYDPQTSGGLLFSLPASQSEGLLKALKNVGIKDAAWVGEVVSDKKICITIS